ncbi:unnamed protein product, partial [marine sediment metagenome]
MTVSRERMRWGRGAAHAMVAAICLCPVLSGCGGAPPIEPTQIVDITIEDVRAPESQSAQASKLSVIPHADLGPERTRQILRDAEYRTFRPLWKLPLPGTAKVKGGGERRLALSRAPQGWIQIMGQWGYYRLRQESGKELFRLMKVCQRRCFDRAEDRAERITKDDGPHPIRIGGKYGYVAESGTVVIPPQFDDAMPFSE